MSDRIKLPEAHEVHVWQADLQTLQPYHERMSRLLSGDERARAERFCFDDDRRRYVVARGALRILLGQYLEIEPASVELVPADNGKPRVLHGSNFTFNLSHAGDALLIATACGFEVGIDVERLDRTLDIERLMVSVLHPNELSRLLHREAAEMTRMFFRYWTCKEAYLKALGVGLAGDMSSVELVFSSDGSSVRLVDHDTARSSSGWCVCEWEYSPDCMAAVAAGHAGATFKRYRIRELV